MTTPGGTAPGGVDVPGTGRALAHRIATVAGALRRLDAFLPAPPPPDAPAALDHPPPPDVPGPPVADRLLTAEACRALVARALHAASAPLADRMLRRLAGGPAASRELAALAGQPTLAVWETVSDLVQVGLAERDLEHDQVRLTGAGRGVVELLDALAAAAAEEVAR